MSSRSWREDNRVRQNELWRNWYAKNAKKKVAWGKRHRDEVRAWFRELKATLMCEICGESSPECLQFHHLHAASKRFNLSIASSNGRSPKAILAEVAKCRVLCGNCHAKLHWEERNK
ncbi:MAG TPA: hypothetical protein VMZ53_31215 [Kofleriaceae bacterium]|nr:hypothetical protein [Kofleriaceae bacterium]